MDIPQSNLVIFYPAITDLRGQMEVLMVKNNELERIFNNTCVFIQGTPNLGVRQLEGCLRSREYINYKMMIYRLPFYKADATH